MTLKRVDTNAISEVKNQTITTLASHTRARNQTPRPIDTYKNGSAIFKSIIFKNN